MRSLKAVLTALMALVIATATLFSGIAPAAAATCPCTFFSPASTPAVASDPDATSVELGMKFTVDTAGSASAIRFYKGSSNTGTHVGHLWTSTGTLLASVTFTGESASGWQQANLATPIALTPNTTYVVSYRAPKGKYSQDVNYFTAAKDNSPIHTPKNAGVYKYGANVFPNQVYQAANYWVDLVFTTPAPSDTTPPTVVSVNPADNATNVGTATALSATFSEALTASSINTSTFSVSNANGAVQGTVGYDATSKTATFTPSAALTNNTVYQATLLGGAAGIKDAAGNALASNFSWSFATAVSNGTNNPTGSPILLVTSTANPFSSYLGEILKGEGLNEFDTADVSSITATSLGDHRSVVLGDVALSAAQVDLLTAYVNAGGQLIASHPDKKLAPLLGLSDASATLSNGYMKPSAANAISAGITQQTLQFHGTADEYNSSSATTLASLYASSTTATTFPAVTLNAVGGNGGAAAAFSYDLAKSVVFTRQGNPAWSGQDRDGDGLIRSDDLFYGNASSDPQADWVDLAKLQVPQADEQQHLFANLISQMNLASQPLPKFWFLPNGAKAAVVMTGDDHASNGTTARFAQFEQLSQPGCVVALWQCVRGTSYLYPSTPMSPTVANQYVADGFEIATHISSNCANWTTASLQANFESDLAAFSAAFPSVPAPVTNRLHCIAWSDWDTQAKVELAHGIRFDTNYYWYPPNWVADRPGLYTGSGQILPFADPDGTKVDVYQANTQLTDESGQSYPYSAEVLMDNAVGPLGYYAIITANHHTDLPTEIQSDTTIAAAQARGIPVVSAKQMLDWLDGRNASTFDSFAWTGNTLSFKANVAAGAANLIQAMVPMRSQGGVLSSISSGGASVSYTVKTVKGVDYAFFNASNANYSATYGNDLTKPTLTAASPTNGATDVDVNSSVKVAASEQLNAATVIGANVLLSNGSTNVAGGVAYDPAAKQIVFTPTSQLSPNTTYTLSVSGVKDLAGNAIASTFASLFKTSSIITSTIFSDTAAPVSPNSGDLSAITVGVKFNSTIDGYVTKLRFYKGIGNTGTHVGGLWSSSGALLAQATFTNETQAGWQTVTLDSPVPITAGTTYIAGYSTNGNYSADLNAMNGQLGNGTVHSLDSVSSGGNGVYTYGAGLNLPTSTFKSANYWVDVVVQSSVGADTTPPTVTSTSPTSGASNVAVGTAVNATFSEALDASTVTSATVTVGSAGVNVAGTVAYNNATHNIGFTPNAPLTASTTYTATISGVKDVAGNVLAAPYAWTFTTSDSTTQPVSLFGNATPGTASVSDTGSVELGMKFTSDVAGKVTGVRFYKGATNTGTHTGSLWSSDGVLLAQGTFTNETATGWQTLTFATPVAITAGTTYVVSYHAPVGGYAFDANYFAAAKDAAPLHAPANTNGVYQYGATPAFPSSSFNSSNYWVDVNFSAN